mmetsp:Transcript_41610/g.61050  ORF Transcript_41610/g.61050 Transcript_41610/m.61050 type:complete len:211 (+) Transcript_41610:305-937(+)
MNRHIIRFFSSRFANISHFLFLAPLLQTRTKIQFLSFRSWRQNLQIQISQYFPKQFLTRHHIVPGLIQIIINNLPSSIRVSLPPRTRIRHHGHIICLIPIPFNHIQVILNIIRVDQRCSAHEKLIRAVQRILCGFVTQKLLYAERCSFAVGTPATAFGANHLFSFVVGHDASAAGGCDRVPVIKEVLDSGLTDLKPLQFFGTGWSCRERG